MENIILISKCFEKAKIGYISTHIKMNRSTNEILSVSYNWNKELSTNNTKTFNSFESLNTFINELIDLKNENTMEWWNGLTSLRKTQLCDTNTELVGSVRRWETLTEKEVQMIYEVEHLA